MNIPCSLCGDIIKSRGGLLFSPPSYKNENMVYKYHLCRGCYIVFSKPIHEAIRIRKEKENNSNEL